MFRHLDGAAWDYLVIAAYDSWQALAADQTDPGADGHELSGTIRY